MVRFFTLIVVLVLGRAVPVAAQVPRPGDSEYTAQSRLLIVRVVPGDKTAKLYLAGKKAGELDLKKESRVLSITAFGAKKTEELVFKGEGEFYEIQNLPSWREPYELSIRAETRGIQEEVKVPIKKTPKP